MCKNGTNWSRIYKGSKKEQLSLFNKQLNEYAKGFYPLVNNWFDAFDQLKHHLSHCKQKNKVVFIDELPWMDTARSRYAGDIQSEVTMEDLFQ